MTVNDKTIEFTPNNSFAKEMHTYNNKAQKSFQNYDFFFSELFLYCKQSVVYNVSRANEEQFVLVNDVDIVSNIVKTF